MDLDRLKLGKGPAKQDAKRLRLAKYSLPAPPAAADWTSGISDFGAMLNDQLGCCVFAGLGHAIQTVTAAVGNEYTVEDATILGYYEQWAGYQPGDPATDQGYVEVEALNRWRREGFGDPGMPFSLVGYADPNPRDAVEIKQAVALFGGVYLGLQLPLTAQAQVGRVWKVVAGPDNQPGSWGGHAVWCARFDPNYLACITWGQLQPMTWDFVAAYCDEAHALLLKDWLDYGQADYHFLGDLQADLRAI